MEEHPQDLGVEARVEGRRTTHEGQTSHGSSFGPEHGSSWSRGLTPSFRLLRVATHAASLGLRFPRHLYLPTLSIGRVETNIRKSAKG